jgi:heme/copper-type cytochrome/quinol oxidase subunit 2
MTFAHQALRKLAGMSLLTVLALHSYLPASQQNAPTSPRVIEVLADHDSRYKMEGLKQPEITVKVGEKLTLRITARRAKNRNRDGAIHGFTLLRAKDQKPVPDWDFALMPGTQEFNITAPQEPGEYIVVCTVICSEDHEGMRMKFVVLP